MDTRATTDPQIDLMRRLSPADKLSVAHQLRRTAWALTAAGVRLREPMLSDSAIAERVRLIFLRAIA